MKTLPEKYLTDLLAERDRLREENRRLNEALQPASVCDDFPTSLERLAYHLQAHKRSSCDLEGHLEWAEWLNAAAKRLREARTHIQEQTHFRVVLIENPHVSPFPSHVWPTRELVEKFCASEEAGEWKGKLRPIQGGTREEEA